MTTNPLLTASPLPHGLPPFTDIDDEHYLPAFEDAMAEQRREVAAIAAEAAEPTFDDAMPRQLGDLYDDWEGRRVSVKHYKVLSDSRPSK